MAPNHTHFILVDDGSEGMFRKEIDFRARLEDELRKGHSLKYYERKRFLRKQKTTTLIYDSDEDDKCSLEGAVPMILIVVQGGPNTLLTVEDNLKKNIPVLVLAVILNKFI